MSIDNDDDGSDANDSVDDSAATVICPYCGQAVMILLDTGGGTTQDYVEDCEVCCNPWQVHVRYASGAPEVRAKGHARRTATARPI